MVWPAASDAGPSTRWARIASAFRAVTNIPGTASIGRGSGSGIVKGVLLPIPSGPREERVPGKSQVGMLASGPVSGLEPAKQRAAVTYNLAADHYEQPALGFWAFAGGETVRRLELHPGDNVLDAGCGTGCSAIPAAVAVGPEGSVLAVDLADRLLELARAKADARGLANVEFVTGDMERLELTEESFDAVISVFSIFFVADMDAQVSRFVSLLRPGGRLAVTTWGPDLWQPAYGRWKAAVNREREGLVGEFNPWDRITTPEAVVQLLRAGGLDEVIADPYEHHQSLSSPEDWWSIVIGSGLRWQIEQLGPEGAARVRSDNVGFLGDRGVRSVPCPMIFACGRRPNS